MPSDLLFYATRFESSIYNSIRMKRAKIIRQWSIVLSGEWISSQTNYKEKGEDDLETIKLTERYESHHLPVLSSLNCSPTILNIYGINYKFADPGILGYSSFPFRIRDSIRFSIEMVWLRDFHYSGCQNFRESRFRYNLLLRLFFFFNSYFIISSWL